MADFLLLRGQLIRSLYCFHYPRMLFVSYDPMLMPNPPVRVVTTMPGEGPLRSKIAERRRRNRSQNAPPPGLASQVRRLVVKCCLTFLYMC